MVHVSVILKLMKEMYGSCERHSKPTKEMYGSCERHSKPTKEMYGSCERHSKTYERDVWFM